MPHRLRHVFVDTVKRMSLREDLLQRPKEVLQALIQALDEVYINQLEIRDSKCCRDQGYNMYRMVSLASQNLSWLAESILCDPLV